MRIGRLLVTVLAAAVAVAGCGSADVAREPVQFTERSPLPSCGTFEATALSLTAEQRVMVDCILRAAEDGTPRELDLTRPGTDCCELRTVLRVLRQGDVVMFTARDGREWARWECESIGFTGEPFGFPEGKSCAEHLSL